MKKKKIGIVLIVFIFSLTLFKTSQAFSLFDFLKEIKSKFLNSEEEKIVREIRAKKTTLDETLSLIIENYESEKKSFEKYCPITENLGEGNIFQELVIQNLPVELPTSTPSSTEELFKSFDLEKQTEILFEEKVCQSLIFINQEIAWNEDFQKKIDEIDDLDELNDLISLLKEHSKEIKEGNGFVLKLSAVLNSLDNLKIAENREGKIGEELREINLDDFSNEVVKTLFSLASAKIDLSSLKTEKAKLLLLYSQSFEEIWPGSEETTSENASSSESEIEKIKKEIALKLSLEKEKSESPLKLLEESQSYIESAYQDFSLISKIVNQ